MCFVEFYEWQQQRRDHIDDTNEKCETAEDWRVTEILLFCIHYVSRFHFWIGSEQNVLCVTSFPSTGPPMWYQATAAHIFFTSQRIIISHVFVRTRIDGRGTACTASDALKRFKNAVFSIRFQWLRARIRETNQNDSNIYYSSADTTTEYYYLFGPWPWIYARIRNTNSASRPIDRAAFRQIYADAWTEDLRAGIWAVRFRQQNLCPWNHFVSPPQSHSSTRLMPIAHSVDCSSTGAGKRMFHLPSTSSFNKRFL